MFLFSALLLSVTAAKTHSSNEFIPEMTTEENLVIKLLLTNPLFKKPGDGVNKKVLVKWVIQNWEFNNSKKITQKMIEELIVRLCSSGILFQKECEDDTHLFVLDSYFEGKKERKVQSVREKKNISSVGRKKYTIEECPIAEKKFWNSMMF